MRPKKAYDGPSSLSLLGTASTMGLHMVTGPLVGGFLGYLTDRFLLDSGPKGLVIGVLLGIVAGFRNVWKDYRYLQRSQAALDEEEKTNGMFRR